MPETQDSSDSDAHGQRTKIVQRLPSGYRVLQVNVPEPIFNAAKAKALLLGKSWPDFVVQLLDEAASNLRSIESDSKPVA